MDRDLKTTFPANRHCLIFRQCAFLACFFLAESQTSGQITLDADFDHGSLDEANSVVNGNFITLVGRDNHYGNGLWKWVYFEADNVNGQQVTFQIDDNFVTGGNNLEEHAMVYSYDKVDWHFFENNNRDQNQGTYTFSKNGAFTEEQVYVAYGIPYPYQRTVAHTASIASSPWVSSTSSANANLIIGQSPGGIDDLGRNIAPRDMHAFHITDPNYAGPKSKIVLLGGVHSQETLANYMLEGLIDFLISDNFEAAMLRRSAEFFVYPMANPDGRFAGYNRGSVEIEAFDTNRHWEPFAIPPYDGQSDIQLVGDSMIADTGGDIDYFIDFHGTVQGKDAHFAYVLPEQQNAEFWLNVQALDPSIETRNSTLLTFNSARFGRDVLNAEFTSTFETQFIDGDNIDRFFELGVTYGLAFEQTLRLTGDLNYDGVIDGLDWSTFIAAAETDLSGLSQIDAYMLGDLDGDGTNSGLDFVLFKEAFETANGIGSFAAMLAQVPEPASVQILTCAYFLSILRHRRQSTRRFIPCDV